MIFKCNIENIKLETVGGNKKSIDNSRLQV